MNFNKDTDLMKRNQLRTLQLKTTTTERKYSLQGLNNIDQLDK